MRSRSWHWSRRHPSSSGRVVTRTGTRPPHPPHILPCPYSEGDNIHQGKGDEVPTGQHLLTVRLHLLAVQVEDSPQHGPEDSTQIRATARSETPPVCQRPAPRFSLGRSPILPRWY